MAKLSFILSHFIMSSLYVSSQLWPASHMKTSPPSIEVKPAIWRNLLWRLALALSGSYFAALHQSVRTCQFRGHLRPTPTHVFTQIHAHWHSIKPILHQGIRFISESNDVPPANFNLRVSLMYIFLYSTWRFVAVIKIPEGREWYQGDRRHIFLRLSAWWHNIE